MALLDKIISDLRIELGDRTTTVWQNDELIRSVEKSVALMSRLTPRRDIIETTITRTVTAEVLTIATSTGTLAYKPIRPGSVVITGKTLDTHYRVNYLTGVVTEIGSGLPDTTYTVSYELDPYMLDLTTLLPDYIKIERVECPVGDTPLSLVTFDVFGSTLVVRGSTTTLTDNAHARIIYLKKWTLPTPSANGDYPSHLDDVVIIGAAGQALIYKAEEYTHLAKTAIASAETTIAAISSVTFPTAPSIATYLTAAGTALTAAIARFQAAVTTLGSMDTPRADADTALNAITSHLAGAKTDYLDVGDSLINTGTRGDRVGEIFGSYAGYRTDIAKSYISEAEQRIALALSYEADAGRDTTIGNSYVNEAIQRLAIAARELDSYNTDANVASSKVNYYTAQLNKAAQQANTSTQYLALAGRYLASGQSKINEFLTALGVKAEFVGQKASQEQRT